MPVSLVGFDLSRRMAMSRLQVNGRGTGTARRGDRGGRRLGNVPQAFSHVCLVNTARNLAAAAGADGPAPAEQRHQ
jgi:hypothetical protein